MLPHAILAQCGRALYGSRWQSEIARDLRVSDRTMRRWASGANAVPDGVIDELRALLRQRRTELAAIIKTL